MILGLECRISSVAFHCKPASEKAVKWLQQIEHALSSYKLCAGTASKMAGALSWTASNLHGRSGRGMLRPLYKQSRARRSSVSGDLQVCLQWWLCVLRLDHYTARHAVCIVARPCGFHAIAWQARPWAGEVLQLPVVTLITDARGHPAHLAAFCICEHGVFYTDMAVPSSMLEVLQVREDDQIMAQACLLHSLAPRGAAPWAGTACDVPRTMHV